MVTARKTKKRTINQPKETTQEVIVKDAGTATRDEPGEVSLTLSPGAVVELMSKKLEARRVRALDDRSRRSDECPTLCERVIFYVRKENVQGA